MELREDDILGNVLILVLHLAKEGPWHTGLCS